MSDGFVKDEIPVDHGFVQVPHGLWLHPELSNLDKVLLGWLWSHDARFLARLSTREIRRQFGGSGAIPGALVRLQETGYVEKEMTGNRTRYRLVGAPWAALFGVRQHVENVGDGPRSGPPERAAIWTVREPRSGPFASRDLDHIEEQLEDHVRRTDDDTPVDNSQASTHAARSSSSDFRTTIDILTRVAELTSPNLINSPIPWRRNTAANIIEEQGEDIRERLARGMAPQEVAYALTPHHVYVRQAMRKLALTPVEDIRDGAA